MNLKSFLEKKKTDDITGIRNDERKLREFDTDLSD